jgi:hypothetical protein
LRGHQGTKFTGMELIGMHKVLFRLSALCLLGFTACEKPLTVQDVKVIDRITHANSFYQFQYLSIPDSASADVLLSISSKIRERDERSMRETVYHYYLGNNREMKFAILHGFYGGRPARDSIEIIQYGDRADSEFDKALKQIQKFKDMKQYVVSDSCYGIWRNWANPFPFYLILYKKEGQYFVETFNPDFNLGMRKEAAVREETYKYGTVLSYKYQEWIGSTPRKEVNTYRFSLNEFGDITWVDQQGKGSLYVQTVYSYLCACDYQQDLRDLKGK